VTEKRTENENRLVKNPGKDVKVRKCHVIRRVQKKSSLADNITQYRTTSAPLIAHDNGPTEMNLLND